METTPTTPDEFLNRLARDFPIHARFDDADVFEANELLVFVRGPRGRHGQHPERQIKAMVRRPIPIKSVPAYLFGFGGGDTTSGMLASARIQRQQKEDQRRPGAYQPPRWTSVLRRRAARGHAGDDPPLDAGWPPYVGHQAPPQQDGGNDVPF